MTQKKTSVPKMCDCLEVSKKWKSNCVLYNPHDVCHPEKLTFNTCPFRHTTTCKYFESYPQLYHKFEKIIMKYKQSLEPIKDQFLKETLLVFIEDVFVNIEDNIEIDYEELCDGLLKCDDFEYNLEEIKKINKRIKKRRNEIKCRCNPISGFFPCDLKVNIQYERCKHKVDNILCTIENDESTYELLNKNFTDHTDYCVIKYEYVTEEEMRDIFKETVNEEYTNITDDILDEVFEKYLLDGCNCIDEIIKDCNNTIDEKVDNAEIFLNTTPKNRKLPEGSACPLTTDEFEEGEIYIWCPLNDCVFGDNKNFRRFLLKAPKNKKVCQQCFKTPMKSMIMCKNC